MKIPTQITSLISENINDKNRFYLISGILLLISLLVILWQIRILMQLNPKIFDLSKELKLTQENVAKFGQYQAELNRYKADVESLKTRILLNEEVPVVLEDISRTAKELKIKINQIMPLRESQDVVLTTDDAKYYSLPILVSVRGGYHDVGRFLNHLETNTIFMNIKEFDITGTTDDPMRHTANITVITFIREGLEEK